MRTTEERVTNTESTTIIQILGFLEKENQENNGKQQ